MKSAPNSLIVPKETPLVDENGILNPVWEKYFRDLTTQVDANGVERAFKLVNNQAVAANIEGLIFSYKSVSQVTVDYLIQRVTTGGGATELIEKGQFYLGYRPTSNDWVLTSGPATAGITLTVTSKGQVQYTSSNITGTASISKITWKARTLSAKHSTYSVVGR